jgi:MobA/MobL family
MATFYLRTRTSRASAVRGAAHADYIAGNDRYSHKGEVIAVIDRNLPKWAKDARHFFEVADSKERLNGRSYRTVIFAIPNEASDKIQWAQDYADELLGNRHAYRLAIHDKRNNPHAHLMFTERGKHGALKHRPEQDEQKDYFSQQNPKDRDISKRGWLVKAKELYLRHIRRLCPTYFPANRFEPKIGPKLKDAGPSYEAKRQSREQAVQQIRANPLPPEHSPELSKMAWEQVAETKDAELLSTNEELEEVRSIILASEPIQTTSNAFLPLAEGLTLHRQPLRPVFQGFIKSNEVDKKADWLAKRWHSLAQPQRETTEKIYRAYFEQALDAGRTPEACALYAVANTAQAVLKADMKTHEEAMRHQPKAAPRPTPRPRM